MPRDRKPSRPLDRPKTGLRSVRVLPRRFLVALGLSCIILLILILSLLSSSSPSLDQLRDSYQYSTKQAKQFFRDHQNLPSLYNPFATGDAAQRPPDQKGARPEDIQWFDDPQWQIPFSSSVTLDNERAVLPPLPNRTTIYTYYDSGDRAQDVVEAERALLLSWRRAWWAQGFRPVILGRSDAQKDGLYRKLTNVNIDASVKLELERWVAWSHAGGGILCNYLAFPMTRQSDPLLQFLRKNEFPDLTRFKPLGSGLFVGEHEQVRSALESALADVDELSEAKTIVDALSPDAFAVSSRGSSSIAYYDLPTLTSDYKPVADELSSSKRGGLTSLRHLIDAHLHLTWQNAHPAGIKIVKPYPEHMTTLTSLAVRIAQLLAGCPSNNPMPKSCPPNNSKCKPCTPDTPLTLSLPDTYTNSSEAFHVIPVPHPLTFASLSTFLEPHKLNVRFVRRQTSRDLWLTAATSGFVSENTGAQQRLLPFKDAVASEPTSQKCLWLTAERDDPLELSWLFGFDIAQDTKPEAAESPVRVQAQLHKQAPPPAPKRKSKPKKKANSKNEPAHGESSDIEATEDEERIAELKSVGRQQIKLVPTDINLSRERQLMQAAAGIIDTKGAKEERLRDMVEAWNLADLEAWRFVRAYAARREKEREVWEKEEKGSSMMSGLLS